MQALAVLWALLLFLSTGSSKRFQYVTSKFYSTDSAISKQASINALRAKTALQRYNEVIKGARRRRKAAKRKPAGHSFKTSTKAFALVGPRPAWSGLREAARRGDGGVRLPHPDIGFYNHQLYDHRRYMRIMADFFGIRGFCFYHYWRHDRPVRPRALEMMLVDGEPDKPFFLCWDLAGPDHDTLDADSNQSFSNATGNLGHFKYLHSYFRHLNYLKIHGRPILAIKGVSPVAAEAFDNLLDGWNALAMQMGFFKGLYFVRFFADVTDENVVLRNVAAHVEIEPQRWMSERIADASAVWSNAATGGQVADSSSKQYSKETAWESIENRIFYHHRDTFYSAFFNWNSGLVARTDAAVMIPEGLTGFDFHLKYMIDKTDADFSGLTEPLLLLSSWNDWYSQSAFEPNSIDGYDALMSLKKVSGILHEKIIVHVSNHHEDEAKNKHISDLMFMYMDYLHLATTYSNIPSLSDLTDVLLLHVHDAMQGKAAPRWDILDFIRQYVAANISVCVTVHDYQYLYPDYPLPPLEAFTAWTPSAENVRNTRTMFRLATAVIFPSTAIQRYYMKHLEAISEALTLPFLDKLHTVPHMDTMVDKECVRIPDSVTGARSAQVNVVLISDAVRPPEGDLFYGLVKELQQFEDESGFLISIMYTLFDSFQGDPIYSGNATTNSNVVHLALALESSVYVNQSQHQHHILLSLSSYPEPYSYRLNEAINTGLPIVYLNPSSMAERIGVVGKHSRYFPVSNIRRDLVLQLKNAAKFVVDKQGETELRKCSRSKNIQPSKWYMSHYPNFLNSMNSRQRTPK